MDGITHQYSYRISTILVKVATIFRSQYIGAVLIMISMVHKITIFRQLQCVLTLYRIIDDTILLLYIFIT